MKVIFVGDKPSPRMKPGAKPFEGAACEKRLKEWISFLGCEEYEITNSDTWDFTAAALSAIYSFYGINAPNKYRWIALGNRASNILNKLYLTHFKLPHPSGRNRQINDKDFINKQLELAKEYICGDLKQNNHTKIG